MTSYTKKFLNLSTVIFGVFLITLTCEASQPAPRTGCQRTCSSKDCKEPCDACCNKKHRRQSTQKDCIDRCKARRGSK
jgi:hypothetical protein